MSINGYDSAIKKNKLLMHITRMNIKDMLKQNELGTKEYVYYFAYI